MSTAPSRPKDLPPSEIPIFTTVSAYRKWRNDAFKADKSVGFVATMGALHDGHLSLVKHSLAENDLTVVSIFINPAQFAPHEDLTTYPRTLAHDLSMLSSVSVDAFSPSSSAVTRTTNAVFAPTVSEMYPSGITQNLQEQKGTFVEVHGFSHQMEGQTRPTFFRGVATVVTKLFSVIQPTRTYFGQKDIQQALLLRRMVRDLLLANPTSENVHIVPIARDPKTDLALSSRNAYLTPHELTNGAPALAAALRATADAWETGETKAACVDKGKAVVQGWVHARTAGRASEEKVELELDYIEMNDPDTFDVLDDAVTSSSWETRAAVPSTAGGPGRPVVLSGAMYVGPQGRRTRLIDNLILGNARTLGVLQE